MAEIKFKCPSCGAEIIAQAGVKKIKCEYCDTIYLEEEFREDIINSPYKAQVEEAARLRNNCDFEEAQDLLDSLIIDDPKNPEVYFQLLLLEYGITYVDESNKIRQVPVFNFIKKEPMTKSIYYDKIFKSIVGNAIKENSYKEKIEGLEKLRQKVYDTYSKDEPYQIFISFKKSDIENPTLRTRDLEIARRLYDKFTREFHLKVFFSEETLKDVAGLEYEPHIFSALYSSKVFLLICASPDKPEYIRTPWIKSEWQRFAKRYDTEIDNKLALIPVFCNGYSPSLLPGQLQRFEGYELNEEFYENMKRILARVLTGSKKSQFQQLNIGTKSFKLKTNKETITLRGFSDHKDLALEGFEKTDFDVAVANMKARTKKDFARAYEKLERITQTNKYNYDANLAKLKCDFLISFDESLVNASFLHIRPNSYEKISQDLLSTLEVASEEDRERIIEAFVQLLLKFYEDANWVFVSMLDSPNDLLLTVLSAVEKPKMLEIIQRFEEVFKDFYKGYNKNKEKANSTHWKSKKNVTDISIHKLFKKYYSNFDEDGALLIINLLTTIAKKAGIAGDYAYADKLYKEILEINEFDSTTTWNRFLNCTLHTTSPHGEDTINLLAEKLSDNWFRPFPVGEELPDMEANKDNLYFVIVKMISGGSKLNLSSEKSPFYVIFQAAMRMFNQKGKVKVAKQIIRTFTEMAESAKASPKEINYILMRSANRLLLEELYEEAEVYFKEVLVRNPKDEEAYWGLTKCEAQCPSNFSLLFYKKDLSDLQTYRTVITYFKQNHPDAPTNPYLDYYSGLRNIKATKNKDVINAFKFNAKKLKDADDPQDEAPGTILSKLQSGTLVEEMRSEIVEYKGDKYRHKLQRKEEARGGVVYLIIAILTSLILGLGGLAAVTLLHPFIATLVLLALWGIGSGILAGFPRTYHNGKFAIFLKLFIGLLFIAAVVFGRIIFIGENGSAPDARIYFLYDADSENSAQKIKIYHYISLGLIPAFFIAMLSKHLSGNLTYDDDIEYKVTFKHLFLIAIWCYMVYSAQLLLGGFALLPSIIGGLGLYGVGFFALLRDE